MHPAKSPVLFLAAAASAVAGLVHASAAGSHAELGTLAVLFGLTAIAQLGWAALVVIRNERFVVVAGMVLQMGALGTWLAARTVGIAFVDGLDGAQTLGLQDGLAVGLEIVAFLGAGVSLLGIGSRALPRPLVPVLAAAMVVAVVPAMATEHDHTSHDHDDTAEVAAGDDPAAHGHGDHPGEAPAQAADQPDGVVPTTAELGYPAAFVSWLDTAETPAQRDAAETLLIETTEAMKAFPDEAAVQAAGYISIGDGGTGWEHYINVGLIADPAYLDPNGIESIVLKVNPDGTKEVASAMYLLPFGFTMDDAPDIAGDLTPWHDHQNLCWEGSRVVGTTDATGSCVRGDFRETQPMIHVWVMDHECGPFAGIEGSHGSGCSHGAHDAETAADGAAPDDGHPDHDH